MKIQIKTEVRNYSIYDTTVSRVMRNLTGEIEAIIDGIKVYVCTVGELAKTVDSEEKSAKMPEYNLKAGAEVILKGDIEYGMPLTFTDSNETKITTEPVTYIKIEQ